MAIRALILLGIPALGLVAMFVAVMVSLSQKGEGAKRAECLLHVRNIAVGVLQYQTVYGVLPPAFTVDADGKPLHSWRTLILPYLDQRQLYDSIDLSKPWDNPANAGALMSMPDVYQCPSSGRHEYKTHFLGIGGDKGCFAGAKPRPLAEITDKPEETLLLIEVRKDQGVPWMAPLDADEAMLLNFDANTEWLHPGGRNAAFVDGHAEFLNGGIPAVQIRRMMTIAGGD